MPKPGSLPSPERRGQMLPRGARPRRSSAKARWAGPILAVVTWLATVPGQAAPPPVDWGRAVVDATLQRYPEAERQPWAYQWALVLYGQHLVQRRTQDPRYLDSIKRWGAAHVQADGTVVEVSGDGKTGGPVDFMTLDAIMPGRLVVILHERTGEDRYRLAAARIRARPHRC